MRVGADEHAEAIDGRRLRGDERWNRRARRFEERDRSIHIELRPPAGVEQLLGQRGRALLIGDVVASDGQTHLRAANIGIGEHDFGRNRHEGETPQRSLACKVGARPGNRGATRAEDVHFPARIDAGVEQVGVGDRRRPA